MKILVAEDDYVSRLSLTSLLQEYGEIDVAVDGAESLEACRMALEEDRHYHLIFMDIMMPNMDGLEASEKIREIEKTFGIAPKDEAKIIMTTALCDPKTVFKAFNKSQATEFLVKPCEAISIQDTMLRLGGHEMTNRLSECAYIIDEFVSESCDYLNAAIDDVLLLEQKKDQEIIDRIFRALHTIKGTASMLGFRALSKYVHRLEDTCSDIRSGIQSVDKPIADGLLKSFDFILFKLNAIQQSLQDDEDYSQGEQFLEILQSTPQSATSPLQLIEGATQSPSTPSALNKLFVTANANAKHSKALIVESDFKTRKQLHSFLSRHMNCSVAKDGSEAIQAVLTSYIGLKPEPFSLIVMNSTLPIIDGIQATTAIRALERAKGAGYTHATARIVVFSTSSKESLHISADNKRCEADKYLANPFDNNQLKQLLQLCQTQHSNNRTRYQETNAA